MKFLKNLVAAALITCLTVSASFAAVEPSARPDEDKAPQQTTDKELKRKKDFGGKFSGFKKDKSKQQDPVKILEGMKKKLQEKVRTGEITKEKADEISRKIDAKIKEIKELDRLPLEEKKDRLEKKFKAYVEDKVKSGKLEPEEADRLIKKFSEKLKEWDGKGYPMLRIKNPEYQKKKDEGNKREINEGNKKEIFEGDKEKSIRQ